MRFIISAPTISARRLQEFGHRASDLRRPLRSQHASIERSATQRNPREILQYLLSSPG